MARHAGSDSFDADLPADWDPLVDPWPPAAAVPQATPLERTVRDEVDPLGLASLSNWTFASESTNLRDSLSELAALEVRVAQPAPAPEIVVPPRDPRREAQLAIETQPVELDLGEHPSGPLPRAGTWPPLGGVPESPAALDRLRTETPVETRPEPRPEPRVESRVEVDPTPQFDVTLVGPLGDPEFGFTKGQWYALAGSSAREVTVGEAILAHPDKAGPIVQLACWYLREKPSTGRALDLATELAMAVSDLARRELVRERRSA
ncbi:hypothetical protein GCM10009547_10800 [Sporichthya brevicatena]|uniref:Uncharacterized protein n=1 Tax=Sporichthya brevicatena TaxID=171442 RepID=A0ABN1GFT8_9ACTN